MDPSKKNNFWGLVVKPDEYYEKIKVEESLRITKVGVRTLSHDDSESA